MAECSFPECLRPVGAYGLCKAHRQQQLKGQDLRPIGPRAKPSAPTECTFDGCDRIRYARGLCKAHHAQQRRYPGHPLWPIGDPARKSQSSRAAWEKRSPEDKAAHIARMTRDILPRSEEHARHISESLRLRHQMRGHAYIGEPRACRGCGAVYTPKVGQHVYCTPECWRLTKRLQKYGITRAVYDRVLSAQNGRCGLCGGEQAGWTTGTGLHIDHCHTTGVVRGLLCASCNSAIGRFGDSPQRLRAAADYLERTAGGVAPA